MRLHRYLPLTGLVVLTDTGCATTIAAKFPHLDRRSVCVLPPEIENDSTEYVFTENNVPISNFHPEVVDRVAEKARAVYEYDPDADPDSVRYLPAPYNELTCPERFSVLPSQTPATSPLPEATMDLSVQKPPAASVLMPEPLAKQLASCPGTGAARFGAVSYTMNFNVYINEKGEAVGAYVTQSTLEDDDTAHCMLEALRKTKWPAIKAAPAKTADLGARMFLAQSAFAPAPVEPPIEPPPESGIRQIQRPLVEPPSGAPGGGRLPVVGTVPLIGPLVAGGVVFLVVFFYPSDDAPAWNDELNPITGQPYTSLQEHEQVQRMSQQQIFAAQRGRAAASTEPTTAAPPAAGSRRNPGQTCDDPVLDELERQKKEICYGERWTCSDTFEKIGKKNEKRLTCPELLPRLARGQACLNARLRIQAACYAGSPEPKHDGQIEDIRKGVKECADKAAVRGPGGGRCQ